MRIDELIAVKKYKHRPFHDVLQDFETAGGEVMGNRDARVLSHPRWNYVFKAFTDDPPYLRYIRWAKRHQHLIAVPRVLGGPWKIIPFYARKVGDNPYLYVVKLEKLRPLTDPELRKHIACWVHFGETVVSRDAQPDADQRVRDYDETMLAYNSLDRRRDQGRRQELSQILDDLSDWRWLAQARREWARYPGLHDLCLAYSALTAANLVGTPDLHADNFMQRADGTLVLTDPLWVGENPYQANARLTQSEIGYDADEPEPPDEFNTIPGGQIRARKRPKPPPLPPIDTELPF